MATESVQVFVRCRPMNDREKELKSKKCIRVDKKLLQIEIFKPSNTATEPKPFTFDGVYDDDSIQKQVYADTAFRLVNNVIEGYNATMFAYGQTGCGKTHTMEGKPNPPEMRGIIPNSFDHIFNAINSNTVKGKKFLVKASYIEIYNEEVRDLLGDDPRARCEVKENKDGTYIKGLNVIVVKDSAAIAQLMVNGNKNRSVGATLMNQTSSRSHSLFMVEVETAEPDEKNPDESKIRVGKLNLVDLAGSERQDKTKAEGERLKEATQINKSLSALGNVIAALVRGKVHIPYRDSKLTRLLQSSLGGNTKTIMMAAISPAEDNYDETLSTLRYANRAKNIKNKPRINEDPKDALLREYQDEIKKLKAMLEAQAKGVPLQQLLDSQAAAAAAAGGASGDRRASIRLKKTGTAGAMVVDDDGRDDDDFVDDDDAAGHAVIANPNRRGLGSASTSEAKLRKKQAEEAAMRKAFEREKEWDETKSVVETLREALPRLQAEAAAAEQAFKETKAALDQQPKSPQAAGSAAEQQKTELTRRYDRLEAKSKNAAAQYAAELDAFKKLDAADKAMSAVVKEQETTTTQRNQLASSMAGASGDAKRKEELSAQLKQLDADRDDQERRANAVAAQMKQERLEYRKVTDMYSALSRLAREKEEADRLEDERARMAAEMDRKRAEEVAKEMARLAKEKAEHDAKVKALADQMAAEKSEKEKLVKLAAEKERQEAIARELAEQMKKEAEAQQKAVLDAKLARERIDEENKERARQTEELTKKIQEEKELHEKARLDLAEKIRKQKEKAREFQQQMADEKKRSAMEKDSLTQKLKQLEDTMLEGDRKSKDAKLQQELALRHAQLVQQQKEAELQRAKARIDEEKAEFESKTADQKTTIARLKKKYKAALEEIKDITAEHDEEKEALNDLLRKVEREAQLRRQIIERFLTDKDYEKFVTQSKWDDAQGKWVLPSIEMAIVLPKIGGTLSEGLPGMKNAEDDVRDLRAMSPHSKQRREYDAKWRQAARNRGRSVGIDHNGGPANEIHTPGGGSGYDPRAGNRSAMHSRVGTASGTRGGGDREGLDSRSGTRGGASSYGNNLGDDNNGRGLSIVASRDAGRPPPAPHSAYIPRGNTGVAGQRKGSAGPRVDGHGAADEHEFDGGVGGGGAYRAPSPKSGPVDLHNLPQGRANFTPAKPPGPPPGTDAQGSSDALLANLPKPKPNFQPALGVPGAGGASAQNSAHNSAQNSEDDDEPVVARDGAGGSGVSAAPVPTRPKFEPAGGGGVVQVKPHMPDTHKRVFEPARIPTSASHGNISGMAEHSHDPHAVDAALNATSALRKKPAFQPAASPALGASANGGAVSDMELGKSSASFNAALNFQPKKASFQPAAVPAPDADGFGGSGAAMVGGGPKTPPRRHFQPAFGAAGGVGGLAGADVHAAADPFANIKSVPAKPAFQPAVFSG